MAGGVGEDSASWIDGAALAISVDLLMQQCHEAAVRGGWWTDLHTGADLHSLPGEPPKRNVPEQLCLIHSEISEALEGYRKNIPDKGLPHRPALEVELADALIRIFDLASGLGLDLPGALVEKMIYNTRRVDHTPASRLAAGGKLF